MPKPASLLAALIHGRRSGDRAAVAATLTRLRQLGISLLFGDKVPPPRHQKYAARSVAG